MGAEQSGRWAVTIAVGLLAAAGAVVAVRAARRKPALHTGTHPFGGRGATGRVQVRGAKPPPQRAAPAGTPRRPAAAGVPLPAAAPGAPNWAGLIALPAVLLVLLSAALFAAWPMSPPVRPAVDRAFPARVELNLPALRTAMDSQHPPADSSPAPGHPCRTPRGLARNAPDAPPCQTVVLGVPAIVGDPEAGDPGGSAEVTATRAVQPDSRKRLPPVPRGRHREWFLLHIRNTGTVGMRLPYTGVWAAAPGWLRLVDLPYPAVSVAPGGAAEQFVAFDVPEGARLSRLRLGGGVGNAVEWVLG